MSVADWIRINWPAVVIPLAVFLAALIAAFWLRRQSYERLRGWFERNRWKAGNMLFPALKIPSILWSIFISVYLGLVVSSLHAGWKDIAVRGLWSLFVISATITALNIVVVLLVFYGVRLQIPGRSMHVVRNTARVIFLIIGALAVLEIWGVSTSPLLVFIVIVVLIAAVAFRDMLPNLFAGLQISAQISPGDYIKLATGEEGYVIEKRWNNIRIRSLDESTIIVPNRQLIQHTVVNYGRPLKKAKDPFHFNSRAHLTELTGLRAKNLRELRSLLKTVPEAVVYYHTHQFLETYHYFTPEPSNDFAVWVRDMLGDEVLGERLAAVDTFEFPNLEALRERLVGLLEEHRNTVGDAFREAMPGEEFHFMKAVSFIQPMPYVAHDLREFVEALRKISLSSLYFHIFESRLRLGRGLNDFSIWLQDSLGENDLAQEIARLDPYTYTLEGLRSALIRLLEKRIK